MDVKVINANEEEVTPDMLKAIVNVIQCQDGELPLGAKAVEYIEKHNLPVAFMPIAAAKQVLLAAAMQEAHLSEAADEKKKAGEAGIVSGESQIDNSLIMGRGLNLRMENEFKDDAGPNIEEAEGSTSVYESSATQPVRQVSSIPEVSIGKGGDPDQQEDPRSCVHVPRYIIICRVSSRHQVHGHSLENQLLSIEESIASGAPREVHNVCGSVYHGVPPAMTEIFEAARSGDTILVYRVDRLGRNMKVFVPWLDKLSGRGIDVRSEPQSYFKTHSCESRG